MGEPQRELPDLLTVDEFLAIDWPEGERHELGEGHVVAMAPPMRAHSTLVVNLAVAIRGVLSRRCDVLTEAGVVAASRAHTYYQADLLVTSEPPEPRQRTIHAPIQLTEVLSPSTQALDRSRKLPDYRQLPSDILHLDSVGLDLALADLYRRVVFPGEEAAG